MKKEEKFKYQFIASANVVRHMINNKAADILAVLQYKYITWKEKGKLLTYKGYKCFYISYSDIREETGFSESVIAKNIQLLKDEGLIKNFQQGLNKPNCYYLDEAVIVSYINKHDKAYQKWRLQIRNKKSVTTTANRGTVENGISGNNKMVVPDTINQLPTNNKNTNNKRTKKNTIHASVEKINKNILENSYNSIHQSDYIDLSKYNLDQVEVLANDEIDEESYDWYEKSEKIAELIENSDRDDEAERSKRVNEIANYLIDLVPQFKGFTISEDDLYAVDLLLDYKLYSHMIADKIVKNAQRISNGEIVSRFINLFVGIREMNNGVEDKYS